jgi:hypothetical protein
MTTGTNTDPTADCRLWWQKLADGIADALCGAIRGIIALFQAWAWWTDTDPRDD